MNSFIKKAVLCLLIIIPSISVSAYNKSLTFVPRDDAYTKTGDMLRMPLSIVPGMTKDNIMRQPITIGAWIRMQYPTFPKVEDAPNDALIFSMNNYNGYIFTNGIVLALDRDTHCLKLTGSTRYIAKDFITDAVISENIWHYVALTLAPSTTSGSAILYLDGEKVGETAYTVTDWSGVSTALSFMFGGYGYSGAMDDVHICSSALSVDDILKLKSDNASQITSLVGWFTLDEVVEGTVNKFSNHASDNTTMAEYIGTNVNKKFISNSYTREEVPDLTTIDETTQRADIPDFYTVVLPSYSEFEGLSSLVFTYNGNVLLSGIAHSVKPGERISITAEAQPTHVLKTITVCGEPVENGSEFIVKSNITPDDFIVNTIKKYNLTFDAPDGMELSILADNEQVENGALIPEGANVKITIKNHLLFNILNAWLDGTQMNITDNSVIEFVMPANDASLHVKADKKSTRIINSRTIGDGDLVLTDEYGTEYIDGSEVPEGMTLTVNATPSTDNYLYSLTANGISIENRATVTADHTISIRAEFKDLQDFNHALTFITNTNYTYPTTEDRFDVSGAIVGMTSKKEHINTQYSVGLWIRPTRFLSGGNVIFEIHDKSHITVSPYWGINCDINGNLSLSGNLGKYGGVNRLVFDLESQLVRNQWQYLLATFDMTDGVARFYYNGEFRKESEFVTPESTLEDALYLSAGGMTYLGSLDEMHVFDHVLSDVEVLSAYQDALSDVNGLVGHYTFDETYSKGLFENLVNASEPGEYLELACSSSSTSGFAFVENKPGDADLSTIDYLTQRRSVVVNDVAVNMNVTGAGRAELYYEDSHNPLSATGKPLVSGEGVSVGTTLLLILTPENGMGIGSVIVNGRKINESATNDADAGLVQGQNGTKLYRLKVDNAKNISVVFGVDVTGIDKIDASEPDNANAIYYNLQGVKVSTHRMSPGIYIKVSGGMSQKVVVR